MFRSTPVFPKAPLGARVLALIIDNIVAFVLVIIWIIAGLWVGLPVYSLWLFAGTFPIIGLIWAIFYAFTRDGWRGGAGIGKRLTGLMVVHLPTGSPCTKGQSSIREAVILLMWLIPVVGWLVEPIAVFVSEGGRRLGDYAANTQVIESAAYARALADEQHASGDGATGVQNDASMDPEGATSMG